MKLFKSDRKDKLRHEMAAADRIRSLRSQEVLLEADPEEVNRRLRNMNYGSTNHQVAAARS